MPYEDAVKRVSETAGHLAGGTVTDPETGETRKASSYMAYIAATRLQVDVREIVAMPWGELQERLGWQDGLELAQFVARTWGNE